MADAEGVDDKMEKYRELKTTFFIWCAMAAGALALSGCAVRQPLMVAHRGAGDLEMPEASLAAYSNAVVTACDIVKLDLLETKDGIAVMGHDEDLCRAMGCNVRVSDVTYDEILAHGFLAPVGGYAQEKIVRLDEALNVTREIPQFWVDFKRFSPKFAENVLQTFKKAGIDESRLMVATFSEEALSYMREHHPTIRRVGHIGIWKDEKRGFWHSNIRAPSRTREEQIKAVLDWRDRFDLFGVNMRVLYSITTPADVAFLRRHGLWVSLWFVQSAETAEEYRRAGADAFVTDHVTEARRGLSGK
jgi:glycerophosphoryl diester phosphodiesterase